MIHNQILNNIVRTATALLMMLLTTATAWAWSGNGTDADPYLIASYNDLLTLRNNVNGGEAYDGKYFKQTADIDWPANTTWTSGIGTDADHRFGGHYDGDGKAIRRLTISGTSTYTGLFGYVRGASYSYGNFKQTTLKNIVLEDCDIQTTGGYAAGICAFIPNYTRVDNCRVSGTISATSYASGITCIYEHSLIFVTNCFADVTVSALKIGKIFAEIPFSAHIVGNYYHDNGDGVGSNGDSYYLTASEAAPLYTVSGSGLTTAATNATVTHGGKHYFASGATVTLTTDDNHIITGSPAFSGTGASLGSVATDRKSMTVTVGTSDVTVSVCSGTENDPYLIASYDDLLALRNNVNDGEAYDGKYFKQTANIDWPANTTWTSGIGTYADHRFGGHYDGDGKAIRRLTISGTSTYTALFGYVHGASNGHGGYYPTTLKNIVLEDCNIQTTGNYAAGILAVAYSENTVENCRVSGTINGNTAAGGIVGYENQGKVKNCFADVTVTASVQTASPNGVTIKYSTVGKIIGYVVGLGSSGDVTGNNYHDDGATDGAGHAVTAIGRTATITYIDGTHATPLYTVGSTNLTAAATNATVTHAGTHYFAAGATVTLTTDDKLINDNLIINGMGASLGSVATDKKSMTVIVGTSDVTVSATLEAALCGDNAMWSISDTDGNGTYETLTISGSGAITSSPWDTDFASSIQRVNISSADLTISGNPFNTLGNDVIIVVPTPAYAVGYSSAAYATKLRVGVGSQLFKVTGTSAADAAYEIATEADLRNLAAAVYQDRQTCYGLTFRQTAPITLSGTFMPIGYCNYSNDTGEYFDGTYDGSGNTISGLSISGDYYAAGLFGVVMSPGAVKNVHLISPTVTSSMSGAYTGALIGSTNNCTVENCLVVNPTVRATASSIDNQVGALVGSLTYGTVQNCYVISPTVSGEGSTQVGAIFGNPYSFDHDLYCTLTNVYYYNSSLEAIGQHDNSEYSKVTNVGRAYTLTLGSGVTTNTAPAFSYNNVDYYYGTITLPAAPAGYIFTYTVNGNAISGNTFSISANSTVACTKSINSADFEQTGTNEYTIKTAAGWGVFCDMLADGETFSGKTVKLDANIGTAQDPISRMAGSGDNPFCGNFDGGSKTLTFTADAADNYCAPFVGVKGGTTADDATTIGNLNVVTTITAADYRHMAGLIALQWGHVNVTGCNATVSISSTVGTKNPTDLYPAALVSQVSSSDGGTLTVTGCIASGTISTNGKYAAGLVGIVQGAASISDCVSSVTLKSSMAGDGTHGGFVGIANSATTITGSIFNGKLLTVGETATGNCGGFVGWGNGTITNCLYAPATLADGENEVVAGTGDYPSRTFGRDNATVTNSYYTRTLGTAQGKQQRTVTAGQNVTQCSVNPKGNATATYSVSGITAYNNGLSRGGTFYFGSEDQVSLTLSHSDSPTGYTFTGYTATNGGTITGTTNPFTLTMPNSDVTVNGTMTANTYTVSFDANGGTGEAMATMTFTYDVPQNLTANTFTRTGYTFAGWNTQADGSGTGYDDGQEVSNLAASGTVTLYAQWTFIAVAYLDENGTKQYCNSYTTLTGSETSLADGWYVAEGEVTFNSTIKVNGDAHLILKDGAVVYVGTEGSPIDTYGISDYGHPLSIYAQSTGADKGQLHVYSSQYGISASNASVHINGGEVTATGTLYGIYASSDGTVTINGGEVTATGTNLYGIYANKGTLTINGGEVTAIGEDIGIYANDNEGTLTISGGQVAAIGNRDNSYGIYASNGTVNISGGQVTAHGNNSIGVRYSNGAVTISGGEVTATGIIGFDVNGGTVTISGGQLTAITDGYGFYIYNNGSVTLGWTNPSDFIFADYCRIESGTVSIAEGKAFITDDGTTYQSGALTSEQRVAIAGKKLYPYVEGAVFYLDENGEKQLCAEYTALTGNETSVPGGWYAVLNDISYNNGITFSGNAHLILADGKTMTANGEFSAVKVANLTIYGQRLGTGKLIATGNPDGEGNGINAGDVTINGGQVTASGSSCGIYAQRSVTINGGQVTATGHEDSGIWAERGNITLGWNRATDFIYANSYDGFVQIKEGKTFIDDNANTYSGTNVNGINGKTLRPNIAVLKGDANGDGVVNVTDIMAVANYILNIVMTVFDATAADVNGDNVVNVTDIMGIANIILNVTPSSNSRANSEVEDTPEPQ